MAYSPMFMTFLMTSTLMVMVSNSWMAIWVGLEMNTLTFCSLFFIKKLYMKKNLENNLKYFIIQSVASAVLILFMSISTETSKMILLGGGTISVLIKMAASPFHSWFIEIMKGTSTSNGSILLTWQKLAPTFMMIYLMKLLILVSLAASAISGVISQMNQKKLNEIMAISSVFNVSWTLLAVLLSIKILFQFLILYWFSVLTVMYIMWKTQFKEKSNENPEMEMNLITLILLANLAGMPPTSGFLAKWILIAYSLSQKMFFITTSMLIISSINLYIYMRTFTPMIVKSFKSMQKSSDSTSKSISFMSLILPMMMIMASLDHAWK